MNGRWAAGSGQRPAARLHADSVQQRDPETPAGPSWP